MSRPDDSGRHLPFGLIGFGGIAAAAALLVLLGPPRDRSAPRVAPTPTTPGVTANGFTLTAASIELPTDDLAFPNRPGVDAMQANCTSCHSPAMILSQPPLTRAQWQGEVEKMVKVYHAPVDPRAVPAIVGYLATPDPQPSPRP